VRALSSVDKVVEARNHSPILSNVVLTAEADRLLLRGTDMEIEVTTSCAAKCDAGTTAAPAKRLLDIARKVTGDEVTMSLSGANLAIKSGRSNFKLPTLSAGLLPTLSAGEFSHGFTANLSALLSAVSFAVAANDPARHFLEGVYLREHEGRLRAVGADGHRLAYQDGPSVEPFDGVILPRKIVGLLSAFDGDAKVELSANMARFSIGNTTFVSRLIEGTYVDYIRFWPKGNENVLRVDRAALRAAVDRVGLVDVNGRGVKLSMAQGSVLLSVKDASGESSEEVPAEYTGAPADVGYQVGYLSEILGKVPGETVCIEVGEGPGTNFSGDTGWAGVLMRYRVAA